MQRFSPILEEFIHRDAHIQADQVAKTIIISEPQNTGQRQLRSVKIKGFQEIYFALKLDHEKRPFLGKLIPEGLWTQSVDAVIFAKVNKRDYIFLIELKSNKSKKPIDGKFKSSKAFLSFLFTIFKEHYDIDIQKNVRIRSVLFDRKLNDGRPQINDKGYYHEGFAGTDSETRIRNFIN